MADNGNSFKPTTATNLEPYKKLTTGVLKLDIALEGGIPTQGIVEISGESGSGKTQMCLQLCLTAQLEISKGGLNGTVAYICTEDSFPIKRLQQLISLFPICSDSKNINYGNNIFIEHVPDYNSLKECLTTRLKALISRKNVKLLIIDSVAALFRGTYSRFEGAVRTQDLRTLAALLYGLNATYGICVLSVNQVTTNISLDGSTVAALGLAWGNMVTTRIQLSKLSGLIRHLKIIFSPACPKNEIMFSITENGIVVQ